MSSIVTFDTIMNSVPFLKRFNFNKNTYYNKDEWDTCYMDDGTKYFKYHPARMTTFVNPCIDYVRAILDLLKNSYIKHNEMRQQLEQLRIQNKELRKELEELKSNQETDTTEVYPQSLFFIFIMS